MNLKYIAQKIFSILIILILLWSGVSLIFFSTPMTKITEAASSWEQTSDSDFTNGTLDNLITMNSGKKAELRLNSSSNWIKKITSNKPSNREYHATASVYGTDKVVLFGGNDGNYNNDTWVYDLSENKWIEKSPKIKPSKRDEHSLVTIYGTDKVVLMGGRNGGNFFNDTWIYDLSEDNWTMISTKIKPGARGKHAMAFIYGTNKIILFGGYYTEGINIFYYNDTWIYDFKDSNWTKCHTINSPSARSFHSMASIHGTKKILLYGGSNNGKETWTFDLVYKNWTRKQPKTNPGVRSSHAMASIYNDIKVALYGGVPSDQEVWIYELDSNNWSIKRVKNRPSNRFQHTMSTIWGTDKILFFGGYYGGYKGDTWIFNYLEYRNNGSYISTPYNIGFNSSLKKIIWDANISFNTTINFQLRTGSNESVLFTKDFVGPDGTNNTFYDNSNSNIWSGHYGDQWIQCIAYLSTDNDDNETPILKSIIITYNCIPISKNVHPLNGITTANNKPIFNWSYTDQDSNQQSTFQLVIANDSEFNNIMYNSDEQISTNHQWQFPIGTSYTKIEDGTWYWKVRIKDNDDDWGYFSTPFLLKIDTTPPKSSITFPLNNKLYNKMDMISGSAFDPDKGSGLTKVEISIKRTIDKKYWDGSAWKQSETWLLTSGTTDWEYDSSSVKWTSGMQYNVRSRAIDNVSNTEIPNNGQIFIMDITSPVSLIENPLNNSWVRNLEQISGSSIDTGGAGVIKVEISIERLGDNKYWDGSTWKLGEFWFTVTGKEKWHYEVKDVFWVYHTQYIIRSRATDNLGNIEVPGDGNSFRFDVEPPEISIFINDDEEYANSSIVKLSIHAEDKGSGLSQMSYSNNDKDWSNWEDFQNEKKINLSEGDGKKYVYLQIKDYSNNTAQTSDTIILDTTPPHSLSIIINDGASETNSTSITLTLKAFDDTSEVYQMSFSNDEISWNNWEEYKNKKLYNLSSKDGIKKIYFRVTDLAGNIAEHVHSSIILNTSKDFDNDNIPDMIDEDDDNDEFLDFWEEFLGTDSKNSNDKPLDTDGDNIPNGDDTNSQPWMDTDDDNDTILDIDELAKGTNPLLQDTDGDGHDDNNDVYPLDPTKWKKEDKPSNLIWVILASIIIIIVTMILIFILMKKRKKDQKIQEQKIEQKDVELKMPIERHQEKNQLSQQSKSQHLYQKIENKPEINKQKYCLTCKQSLNYIPQSNRYYCYYCQKYEL